MNSIFKSARRYCFSQNFNFCGEISTNQKSSSDHRVLVDTKLGTKASFGGVLDSPSDLEEVHKGVLSDTVNKTYMAVNTALFKVSAS